MNARPVMAAPVTLVRVMVIAVAVFPPTVVAANDLLTWGLAICSVADVVTVLAPPLVVNAPTAMVLM